MKPRIEPNTKAAADAEDFLLSSALEENLPESHTAQNRTSEDSNWAREAHHRAKNNFHTIYSLLGSSMETVDDPKARAVLCQCRRRVLALSLVHSFCYRSKNPGRLQLSTYLYTLCEDLHRSCPNAEKHVRIRYQLDETAVATADTATAVGLLTTELVTNALLHAFPEKRVGTITVTLQKRSEQSCEIRIVDSGIGMPSSFDPQSVHSLGFRIVYGLAKQLRGEVEIIRTNGTACLFTFSNDFPEP